MGVQRETVVLMSNDAVVLHARGAERVYVNGGVCDEGERMAQLVPHLHGQGVASSTVSSPATVT